jgi:hypothetical protein
MSVAWQGMGAHSAVHYNHYTLHVLAQLAFEVARGLADLFVILQSKR